MKGVWLGMKYAIPEMIKAGGGSIINTTSLAAQVGIPNQIAYSAAKGGISRCPQLTLRPVRLCG